MMQHPPLATAPARTKRGVLETLAHISIVILTISFVGTSILNWLAQQANRAAAATAEIKSGPIPHTAYANAEGAHFVFTNTASFPQWSCVTAILRNMKAQQATQSFPICTGELAPHASLALVSHFRGDVRDVCGKDAGGYVGRTIDWDSCTFDTREATDADFAAFR